MLRFFCPRGSPAANHPSHVDQSSIHDDVGGACMREFVLSFWDKQLRETTPLLCITISLLTIPVNRPQIGGRTTPAEASFLVKTE